VRRVVPLVLAPLVFGMFGVFGLCGACGAPSTRAPEMPTTAVVFPAEETCIYDPDSRRVVLCTSGVGTITPGDLPEPYAMCPVHQEARYGEDYVVATFSVRETERMRSELPGACCYAHCAPQAFE
jgi:hypothetical protein